MVRLLIQMTLLANHNYHNEFNKLFFQYLYDEPLFNNILNEGPIH
jgi:hypothetical protein